MHGWHGKILHLDLSKETFKVQEFDEEFARKWIGGNGFGAYFLFHSNPKVDPFSPDSSLFIGAGPLSGSFWPQTGRYHVCGRSPLTGWWGEANSGGFFAAEMKYAGYDAFLVEGTAKESLYMHIENDKCELLDASPIWGKNVSDVEDWLQEQHGRDTQSIYIGRAGEKLVRFSAIMHTRHRAAARTGLGALMGSKKLKAICVRGTQDLPIHDPQRLKKLAADASQRHLAHPFAEAHKKMGTSVLVNAMSEIGRFPTRNFQSGVFEHADDISGEAMREKYWVANQACFNCPYSCKKATKVPEGEYACETEGPEYETLNSFGARLGNRNLASILYLNEIANEAGIDTISCGGVIAYAIEAQLNGHSLPELPEVGWGDVESIVQLVKDIIERKGIGDTLAEGIKGYSAFLGSKAQRYVMAIKGMDIPAQDGRAQKSMGLAHVTANRGADHLTAFEVLSETGFIEGIIDRFGKVYDIPLEEQEKYLADRLSPKYKALMVRDGEDFCAVLDSLIACKFGGIFPPVNYFEETAAALSAATGLGFTEAELRCTGARIFTTERAFNLLLGMNPAIHERLPKRMTEQPAPDGPNKGHVVELDYMLREYYELRGWTSEGDVPQSVFDDLKIADIGKAIAQEK